MARTRKPSPQGTLASYLLTEDELKTANLAMQEELALQVKEGKLSYRGHVFTGRLLAAALDAIADATVNRMFPGKPDDPAPFP